MNKKLSAAFVFGAISIVVIYLAYVNYNLPFLTTDELVSAKLGLHELLKQPFRHGRVSQVLMGIIVDGTLMFDFPSPLKLTPRYISMLLAYVTIFLILNKLGFRSAGAIAIASFAIIVHQLDWRNNGLIAFFGGYNLLLAFFMFAVLVLDFKLQNAVKWLLVFLFLMLSFASELFFGLAVIYLILTKITNSDDYKLSRHPFLWAIMVNFILFLITRLYVATDTNAIDNYMFGALGKQGFLLSIVKSTLWFFLYSIPFYDFLGTAKNFDLAVSFLMILFFGFFLITKVINKGNSDIVISNSASEAIDKPGPTLKIAGNGSNRHIPLLVIIFVLAIAPQLLMSIQPMKLDWALADDKQAIRYVFSFYTWICICVLSAYFLKSYSSRFPIAKYVAFIVVSMVFFQALKMNIAFVSSYSDAMVKWRALESLEKVDSDIVAIDQNLLYHPYLNNVIVLKDYIQTRLGKKIVLCNKEIDNGYYFSRALPSLSLTGFSGAEAQGTWTVGPIATVEFPGKFDERDFILVEVAAGFASNADLPVDFTVGDRVTRQFVASNKVVLLPINHATENLKLNIIIPKPTSPASIGESEDTRELGVMIKRIRIIRKTTNGQEVDVSSGCH